MIPEIKKILYPTDLSENARYAFGYAVSLANHYGARITVLHVVEELSSFARSMVREVMGENRWEDLIKEKETKVITNLKSRLEQFCNDVGQQQPDCPFVWTTQWWSPAMRWIKSCATPQSSTLTW